MSEQYQDGTFGDVKPLPDKLKEIFGMIPERQSTIKNVHVGSIEEIEKIRQTVRDEIAKSKGIVP